MINFLNVKYNYEQQPFSFNLAVSPGSIVAVLGASGAGKSTLLNLAAGFIQPNEGDILISGKSVINDAPHQRPLSMLFQEGNLFEHLSIKDNIGLGLHPGLKLTGQQKDNVEAIAKQVGLDKFLDRLPEQLSGGQKQRVALARCFVQKRPILLLDEPFSALDPVVREEMLAIVKALSHIHKVTVLMVTHHISDATNIASHFVFVDNGCIDKIDDIDMLTSTHKNISLQKFVSAGT